MHRMLCCTAVCLTLLVSAAAQPSAHKVGAAATGLEAEVSVTSMPTTPASRMETPTLGQRAGLVAGKVFHALAAQNTPTFGIPESEWDAVLRPPTPGGGETILHEAKALYDEATTYRTSSYDLHVDPLSLEWRVRIRLGALFSGGGDQARVQDPVERINRRDGGS